MLDHMTTVLAEHPWSYGFLAVSLIGAWFTWNAHFPPRWPASISTACFFAGWLTVELAAHHLLWQLAATGFFVVMGALDHGSGVLGIAISTVSWAALLRLHRRGEIAADVAQQALAPLREKEEAEHRPVRVRHYALPFQMRQREVEVDHGRVYAEVGGKKLRADVYYRSDRPANAPVLVFAHGGGWVIGFKRYQALPMLNRMAALGWVCVSVDYRLSPKATFPDHVADLNRGIAWARAHAHEYGGDGRFIALSGNSAGGHLASLAGLTWDDENFKPGIEDADTRTQAVVSFYAPYDLTNRFGHWPNKGIMDVVQGLVFKTSLDEHPELFDAASPISRVREDAPPWLAVHGNRDTLVPVKEARRFTEALGEVSSSVVCYAEIPDAQHAFEIFRSVRGHHTLRAVQDFLQTVYDEWREDQAPDTATEEAAE